MVSTANTTTNKHMRVSPYKREDWVLNWIQESTWLLGHMCCVLACTRACLCACLSVRVPVCAWVRVCISTNIDERNESLLYVKEKNNLNLFETNKTDFSWLAFTHTYYKQVTTLVLLNYKYVEDDVVLSSTLCTVSTHKHSGFIIIMYKTRDLEFVSGEIHLPQPSSVLLQTVNNSDQL